MTSRDQNVILPVYSPGKSYSGYIPKTPADFEHCVPKKAHDEVDTEPGQTIQTSGAHPWLTNKKVPIILIVIGFVFFVATVCISIFNLECKIGLCLKLDRSSSIDSFFQYKTFTFVAPFRHVWAAFSVSVFGISIASLFALIVAIQKRGINDLLANFAAVIRIGLRSLVIAQLKYLLVVLLPLFIFTGLVHSWHSSGCFAIGAVLACFVQYLVGTVATRGSPRSTAAAQESLKACMESALRTGSIIGIAVLSLGLTGTAISYLIFQNVRALLGFVLGVAVVSLFSRMTSGIYKKVSEIECNFDEDDHYKALKDDARSPVFAASSVGTLAGNVAGVATDFMASHAAVVVVTAILGSSLPYFYDNPYALCVFNHVFIDRTCVAYKAPTVKASIAASVCRRDTFYTAYAILKEGESNSLFVGLPFILAIIGLLSTTVSCLHFLVPKVDPTPSSPEARLKFFRSMHRRYMLHIAISLVVTLACVAAVCWSIFGAKSDFSIANSRQVQYYDLQPLTEDNAVTRCRPLETQDGASKTDLPDLRQVTGLYRPVNSFDVTFPAASQVAWRLFVCFVLGTFLGLALGVSKEYMTTLAHAPVRRIYSSLETGPESLIVEGLASSLVSSVLPMIMISIAVGVSFQLFGTYGVGIAGIGLVSSLGLVITFQMINPVSQVANAECQALSAYVSAEKVTEIATLIGSSTSAAGKGILNGATAVACLTLLAVLVEEAGFIPSPRQLVGSTIIQPSKHITDYVDVNVTDLYVMISVIFGMVLVCLFVGSLLLSGSYARRFVQGFLRQYYARNQKSKGDPIAKQIPRMKEQYYRFMELCTSIGVQETIIPGLFAILTPLIIGFGFGKTALLGFVVATIALSFMFSVTLDSAAGVLESVGRYARGGYSSKPFHNAAQERSDAGMGENYGKGLRDCCTSALPKVVTALAVVSVDKMTLNLQRGWIGIILLVWSLICSGIIIFILRRKQATREKAVEEDEKYERQDDIGAVLNPKYVSPFYEEGPRVDRNQISPTSVFTRFENMEAVGFSDDEESFAEWSPMCENRSSAMGDWTLGAASGGGQQATVTVEEMQLVSVRL